MAAPYRYPPFPWLKASIISVGFITVGYALMKTTVPTEEELYNRMAPDIQKKVDAARALRIAKERETMKQLKAEAASQADPDAPKPIWADKK